MLVYKKIENLVLEGYNDADFADYPDDLKSTSSYVFMMANGAVS